LVGGGKKFLPLTKGKKGRKKKKKEKEDYILSGGKKKKHIPLLGCPEPGRNGKGGIGHDLPRGGGKSPLNTLRRPQRRKTRKGGPCFIALIGRGERIARLAINRRRKKKKKENEVKRKKGKWVPPSCAERGGGCSVLKEDQKGQLH